jgi:insulysin
VLSADTVTEHYEEIVKATFHYINLIKDTEVQSWIVNELQNTAAVDFKFRQKSPASKFTSRQAVNLQKPIPREWLLSQSLIREFNPELITKALEHLRPDNFRVMVVSQKCPRGDYDQLERWYKTEYRVEKLSESFMQELQSTVGQGKGAGALKDELHLPHKNEFIPTNFDVQKKKVDVAQIIPVLVKNNALTRLWYKKDDTFWVPKANVFITLRKLVMSIPVFDFC